ncbi:hypothetical protein HanHA89_Chr12g0488031 [Helianthus annuus]|nr:hypothetical protein HanHA89_Chr12g0488031 [Helianthus annuus]
MHLIYINLALILVGLCGCLDSNLFPIEGPLEEINIATTMKKTFDASGVALLLAIILIIHNVLQADSSHDQGNAFSGRNRMLRRISSAPPPPKISVNPSPKPKPTPSPPPPPSHTPTPCPPPPPPPSSAP